MARDSHGGPTVRTNHVTAALASALPLAFLAASCIESPGLPPEPQGIEDALPPLGTADDGDAWSEPSDVSAGLGTVRDICIAAGRWSASRPLRSCRGRAPRTVPRSSGDV